MRKKEDKINDLIIKMKKEAEAEEREFIAKIRKEFLNINSTTSQFEQVFIPKIEDGLKVSIAGHNNNEHIS